MESVSYPYINAEDAIAILPDAVALASYIAVTLLFQDYGLVEIRHYKNTDLRAVLNAWEAATRLAHAFVKEDFITQERKNIAEIYLPNTDTWIAEINGEVKGFIALVGNEVGAIFLQPDCHGKGIGKALMDKAQALHGDLEVEVFKENAIGCNFYSAISILSMALSILKKKLMMPLGTNYCV